MQFQKGMCWRYYWKYNDVDDLLAKVIWYSAVYHVFYSYSNLFTFGGTIFWGLGLLGK